MPQIVPTVFKEEQILGQYPGELNEGAAHTLARAFAVLINARKVIVGRDARASSESLASSFIHGLLDQGVEVHDIGVASGPYLGFACQQADYDGSVFVTGAHNNPDQNGFVLTRARSEPITRSTGLLELGEIIRATVPTRTRQPGTHIGKDYSSMYLDSLARKRVITEHRIAVDAGGGMAALTIPAIMQRFPEIEVVPVNMELDPHFTFRHPDPNVPDALVKLKGVVRMHKCDFGVAFDGDGSRFVVVTSQGEQLTTDQCAVLFARRALYRHPAENILYDVQSSRVLAEEIRAAGGRPVPIKAHQSEIRGLLRKEQALCVTDEHGRFYFKDYYGLANADYALLELLELLTDAKKALHTLVAESKRYMHMGDMYFVSLDKESLYNAIKKVFVAHETLNIDGLVLTHPDWHLRVHDEGHDQLYRIRLEARTPEIVRESRTKLVHLLESLTKPLDVEEKLA